MQEHDEQQTDKIRPVGEQDTEITRPMAPPIIIAPSILEELSSPEELATATGKSSIAMKVDAEPKRRSEAPAPSEDFGGFDMSTMAGASDPYAYPQSHAPACNPSASSAGEAPGQPLPVRTSGQFLPPYAPGQILPDYAPDQLPGYLPYAPVPKAKAPLYFPLTRLAPIHIQFFGMLFYSLFMALSIMEIILYLVNAARPGSSTIANPNSTTNGLSILLICVLVLLVAPVCSLLCGALFGSWRGLLVSLFSVGGGLLIAHLSNEQFWINPTVKSFLPLLGLPIAAFIVGLIYDLRKYAAWWKSMLTMMLGSAIASIWLIVSVIVLNIHSGNFAAQAATSPNPQTFMASIWIAGSCLSIAGMLGLTFPIAGIEGLLHWRIAASKKRVG